jgi:hypothetical protein
MSPVSNRSPLECEPVSWRLGHCRRETEFHGLRQAPQKPELPCTETETSGNISAKSLKTKLLLRVIQETNNYKGCVVGPGGVSRQSNFKRLHLQTFESARIELKGHSGGVTNQTARGHHVHFRGAP